MALLEPRLCVLDETDSGLDIDALKIVADGVNALRSPERSFVVITHYQRLLDYIVPDIVHVLSKGRIVQHRRQGAGARARGQGLRRNIRTRRRKASRHGRTESHHEPTAEQGARRRLCRRAQAKLPGAAR